MERQRREEDHAAAATPSGRADSSSRVRCLRAPASPGDRRIPRSHFQMLLTPLRLTERNFEEIGASHRARLAGASHPGRQDRLQNQEAEQPQASGCQISWPVAENASIPSPRAEAISGFSRLQHGLEVGGFDPSQAHFHGGRGWLRTGPAGCRSSPHPRSAGRVPTASCRAGRSPPPAQVHPLGVLAGERDGRQGLRLAVLGRVRLTFATC